MKPFSTLLAGAALGCLAVTVVACSSAPPANSPPDPNAPGGEMPCTTEAKVCPDGSAVGRSGPKCEFAPCPDAPPGATRPGPPGEQAPPPMQACTKEAKVCPDGSTVGRTGPSCAFAPCPGEGGHGSAPAPGGASSPPAGQCKNLCGNGTCEEIVCQAVGCPCSESKASCPQDCKK